MGIVPCCWKRWWTRNAFAGFAIGLPTGSMLGRAPGADAWIGHTKVTVKPSKTSTCIWSAMLGNFYAVFPSGKQILFLLPKHYDKISYLIIVPNDVRSLIRRTVSPWLSTH